ncbi:MAG: TetR/AcrR family transcriptional regulator [Lachnospiraceae bacterium]|nr:TetR/AcrR family transcriptional regulator [Lachnospiraceae bacterium]
MSKEYSPKEKAIYDAIIELFEEGADLNNLTVAEITGKAGIGKGTAYEYFSDKEEMIAKALFYNSENLCRQVYNGVCREKDLYSKVNYVLVKMEQQISKANCILRLVMMMSENSMVSRRMREMVNETLAAKAAAINIIKKVLENEFTNRKILSEDLMEYLALCIYSRIMCYAMILKDDKFNSEDSRNIMRKLVTEGICRDVSEMI